MVFLLVLATLACVADLLVAFIVKFILSWFFNVTEEDHDMRNEMIDLKKQMNSLSMVDEFAKYARLQRRYNKLQDQVKDKMNDRATGRLKMKLGLTYGIRFLNGLFTTILVYIYRNEPVITYPKGMLWPVEPILSYPTEVDHCISLPIYILIMKLSVRRLNIKT